MTYTRIHNVLIVYRKPFTPGNVEYTRRKFLRDKQCRSERQYGNQRITN